MACDYEAGLLLVIDVHMNLRTRRVLEMPRTHEQRAPLWISSMLVRLCDDQSTVKSV